MAAVNDKKGIKELLEAVLGLKVLAKAGKAILSDGKVSIADLPVLVSLVSNQAVLVDAASGLSDVPAEVKDLDLDEIKLLVGELLKAFEEVKAA